MSDIIDKRTVETERSVAKAERRFGVSKQAAFALKYYNVPKQ